MKLTTGFINEILFIGKVKKEYIDQFDYFIYIAEHDAYISIVGQQNERFIENNHYLENVSTHWKAIYIDNITEFETYGLLAAVLNQLAQAEISVLVYSSFQRDYILVQEPLFQTGFNIVNKVLNELRF